MKEPRTQGLLPALAFFAAIALGPAAPAQTDLVDRKFESLLTTLEQMLADDANVDLIAAARRTASDYLDALGNKPERRATELLLGELRRHESGPFLIAGETTTQLLDEVRYQRTRGRPARMVPPLLALHARHPKDARVL